jgi:hypothetical protein
VGEVYELKCLKMKMILLLICTIVPKGIPYQNHGNHLNNMIKESTAKRNIFNNKNYQLE